MEKKVSIESDVEKAERLAEFFAIIIIPLSIVGAIQAIFLLYFYEKGRSVEFEAIMFFITIFMLTYCIGALYSLKYRPEERKSMARLYVYWRSLAGSIYFLLLFNMAVTGVYIFINFLFE
jgi:hypothetical protein